jgi:(2Fe-2S) ferredoxin
MAKQRKLVVCTKGKKCPKRGSKDILRELRKQADDLGVDIRVESSDCLKMCKFGPSVLALPDDVPYGGVEEKHCAKLVQSHADGEVVEHLVVKRKGKKKK